MALLAGHRSPYATDLLPSLAATAGASGAAAPHVEYLHAMESECGLLQREEPARCYVPDAALATYD